MEVTASDALAKKRCPKCDGFIFRPGPRGGISQNMECVGCGTRYNFTYWLGEIIFAQVIDNTGEWREDMFPKALQ